MVYQEKTIKSETVFSGKLLSLKVDTVELPNKKYSRREIIEHPGAVVILPILEDGRILLVNNFRTAVGRILLEVPAGKIERGEEPKSAAKRELLEETGFKAKSFKFLFDTFTSPGFTNEKHQYFLANNLKKITDELDDEIYSIEKLYLNDLIKQLDQWEIMDAKTIIGILYLDKIWSDKFPNLPRGNPNET